MRLGAHQGVAAALSRGTRWEVATRPLGEAVQHNTQFAREKQPFKSIIRAESYLNAGAATLQYALTAARALRS